MFFNTSVEYIMNRNSGEKAKAIPKNTELLQRFKEVEALPEQKPMVFMEIIGAYTRDFRTKQAYL